MKIYDISQEVLGCRVYPGSGRNPRRVCFARCAGEAAGPRSRAGDEYGPVITVTLKPGSTEASGF